MGKNIYNFAIKNFVILTYDMVYMGESFQDYSWIQDFEADFPWKVSLKILN